MAFRTRTDVPGPAEQPISTKSEIASEMASFLNSSRFIHHQNPLESRKRILCTHIRGVEAVKAMKRGEKSEKKACGIRESSNWEFPLSTPPYLLPIAIIPQLRNISTFHIAIYRIDQFTCAKTKEGDEQEGNNPGLSTSHFNSPFASFTCLLSSSLSQILFQLSLISSLTPLLLLLKPRDD